MPTPVFNCGFECGKFGPHWTDGGSDFAPTFTTSSPLNGLRSLKCAGDGGSSYAVSTATYGAGKWVIRFRVRFNVLPTSGNPALLTIIGGVVFKSAEGKIYAAASGGGSGATGVSVTAGVDYYIDCAIDTTVNPRTTDVKVNGEACGQASAAVATSTVPAAINLGVNAATTFDILFDDLVLSLTPADYPIGNGKGLSFVPNADGTHTGTTTHFKEGTAASPTGGASITSATTDAFNWVNGRPIGGGATDATRLINQATAASAEYVEVDFEPTTEPNPPQAVEVLTVDQQATTAAGDFATKLNDNGTEDTIIARTAAAGVITDRYATKQYATMVGGGAWTLARFNALKARFGYSADATPDQYWRGIMIEADFPTPTPTGPTYPQLERQPGRGQMRGSY